MDELLAALDAADKGKLIRLATAYATLEREARNLLAGVLPGTLLRRGLLDEALALLERCVEDQGLDVEERSSVRANWAVALMLHHRRTGTIATLQDAITAARATAEDGMAIEDELAGRLATVAHLHAIRASGFNSPSDLDAAIMWLEQATRVPSVSAEKEAECRSDLAGAWRDKFARTGDPAFLTNAIKQLREAVRLDTSDRPEATTNRVNLAGAVRIHASLTGDVVELDESIAQILTSATSEPHHLHNLGLAYRERHRLTGDLDDLASARAALRQALAATNPAQQFYAAVARDLAEALDHGSEEALLLLEECARHPSATAASRFGAASAVARLRTEEQALPWWRLAVDLLPVQAWRGSLYRDREAAAARFAGVAGAAASHAVAVGRPDEAVEMLEVGRGVLWNQLLEVRTDLERLRGVRPDLAVRLIEIQDALDASHNW